MSTGNILSSDDQLLKEVFEAYLKLPVFPVPLVYHSIEGTQCLVEPSRSHLIDIWKDPLIQDSLLEWISLRRTPYFVHSIMYTEYVLCRELIEQKCHLTSYNQFKCFKMQLASTKGGIHLELWLKLKNLFPPFSPPIPPCSLSPPLSPPLFSPSDSPHLSSFPVLSADSLDDIFSSQKSFDFDRLGVIRRQYSTFLTELKMPLFPVYSDETSKIKWCQHILSQLTQRLAGYWWLRLSSELCQYHCKHESIENNLDDKPSEEYCGRDKFESVLSAEHSVGRPFLDFLQRGCFDTDISRYNLIENINEILQLKNTLQFKRGVIICANKYSNATCLTPNELKQFENIISNSQQTENDVREHLYDIQEMSVFILRRKWTSFLHDDYESFCRCFPLNVQTQLLPTSMCPITNLEMSPSHESSSLLVVGGHKFGEYQQSEPKPQFQTRHLKTSSRKINVTLSASDLLGTPLASLSNNQQTLEDFKTFLSENHGITSVEYASLEMWLAILCHQKKVPRVDKSWHARKIYRNFLSQKAKSKFVWKYDKVIPRRPGSPLLEDLQMQAFENFGDNLIEFLKSLHGDTTRSNSRLSTDMQLFEATFEGDEDISLKELNHVGRKLHQFLLANTSGKTQRLRAFERYLIKQGPQDCPHLLLNSVHYWLEVYTFQNLQRGSPDPSFMGKKIIALVNRYLDTATPPWVKIAISNEMAHELTETADSLTSGIINSEDIEIASELLTKSKMAVLLHLTHFWIEFNRAMSESPSHETVDLTQKSSSKSSLISKSSIRSLHPPSPPPEGHRSSSVLSFSRQDGLQWRSQY